MKGIIKLSCTVFMALLFAGCNEKTSICSGEGYLLPLSIWNSFYPYQEGEEVVFHNDLGQTLVLKVDGMIVPSYDYDEEYYTYEYNCDHPYDSPMHSYVVVMKADNGYRVDLSETGDGKENAIASFYVIINSKRAFKYKFEGNIADFDLTVGDTIPYMKHGEAVVEELSDKVTHVRNKGLVSFYDIENQCVWRLVE